MANEKTLRSKTGCYVPRLKRAEATVAALGRMWLVAPAPLRFVVWAMTFVLVAAVLRCAEVAGIDPFSGAGHLLLDAVERARAL